MNHRRLVNTIIGFIGILLFTAGSVFAYADSGPTNLSVGDRWTSATEKDFYSRDQGSQLMPLQWFAALKQPNGHPFIEDSLSRYGYLANEWSEPPGLPVGFTVHAGKSGDYVGLTCAACHTRQITVGESSYRIDGGPAIVDFGSFVLDLDAAVKHTLDDQSTFDSFADTVLGPKPGNAAKTKLHSDLTAWYAPFDALVENAKPDPPWGFSRVDAVGMIMNRLAGLDLGPPPTYLIKKNIQHANAPARYPFLWNATMQDWTQWPGLQKNGSDLLGLARNLGEVIGVFAEFHPKKSFWRVLGINYVDDNSANYQGLQAIEDEIRTLPPPKWPWPVDRKLAAQGKLVFHDPASGSCASCHGVRPSNIRQGAWDTPLTAVDDPKLGTDTRECSELSWRVSTGVLNGAGALGLTPALQPNDYAINVLKLAVIATVIQHKEAPFNILDKTMSESFTNNNTASSSAKLELKGAYRVTPGAPGEVCKYEARVLRGIWAAAPYLHNGSVPSLTELLKPASERVPSFMIGPEYDPVTVGLATKQTMYGFTLQTTDCSDVDSGNSRCGHTYGTDLKSEDKRALLEYLKIIGEDGDDDDDTTTTQPQN